MTLLRHTLVTLSCAQVGHSTIKLCQIYSPSRFQVTQGVLAMLNSLPRHRTRGGLTHSKGDFWDPYKQEQKIKTQNVCDED